MDWRARNAAARERGAYSTADRMAWLDSYTCPVGEYTAKILETEDDQVWRYRTWVLLDRAAGKPGGSDIAYRALLANDFDAMDRLLDTLEDSALTIKRQGVDAAWQTLGRK